MAFTPLVNGEGTPSPQAVLERSTGICCAYGGSEGDFRALLVAVGGGQLLRLVQDPNTLPPDWAVTKCGGVYQVWIAGTAQSRQLLNQVSGGLWTPGVDTFGVVNSFWLAMTVSVSADIAQVIADDALPAGERVILTGTAAISILPVTPIPGLQVEFIGDSYGSAVAVLMASAWAAAYGAGRISCCAFGAPKVFTARYAGPLPGVYLRPHRNGDPVPYLPPTSGFRMTDAQSPSGEDSVGGLVVWQHYGMGLLIEDNGLLVPDPYDTRESWLALGVFLTLRINQHIYGNVAAFLANLQTVPGALNPQGVAVVAVLGTVVDLPSKPGFITPPPPDDDTAAAANAANFGTTAGPLTPATLPATQTAFWTGTVVNWISPVNSSGGAKVALTIRPPVDQSYLRVTMFLRARGVTISESHFYNSQASDVSTLKTIAGNLLQRRMNCAPVGVLPLRYRVSVVGRPRLAQSYLAEKYPAGLPGTQNISVDSVCASMGVQQLGVTPALNKEARIFMAFPTDLSLQDDLYYNPTGVANDPAYDAALSIYLNYLVGTSPGPSNWGVLAYGSSFSTAPPMAITGIAVVAGAAVATVNVNLPVGSVCNLRENDVVGISRMPAVSPTNPAGAGPLYPWNKFWYVNAAAALVAGPGTFTIKLGYPGTLTSTAQGGGTATNKYLTFWPYSSLGPIFPSGHKRGVRSFQPLGRRKIRRTVGY